MCTLLNIRSCLKILILYCLIFCITPTRTVKNLVKESYRPFFASCPTSFSLSTSTSLMHVSVFTYMYLCPCFHVFFHGTFNMHDFNLLCLHLLPTISSSYLLRAHCKKNAKVVKPNIMVEWPVDCFKSSLGID